VYQVSAQTADLTGQVYYVMPGANGTCSSWADACELQTAISNAEAGDQIWVAKGIYKPTTPSNRQATFQLNSGVAIYGGFPVAGGAWEARDWEANPTTLSGDIGEPGSTDNSYHVVTGSGVDATAILDGFTVSGGNANSANYPYFCGGGMYNDISPTLAPVNPLDSWVSENALLGVFDLCLLTYQIK
jgi:hypothetical protein